MRHFIIAMALGLAAGTILAVFFFVVDLAPAQASWEAVELDLLFKTYMAIAGLIFGLVVAFVGYSIVIFRRRHVEEHGAAFRGHGLLEKGWIVVTTLLVLGSALDAVLVLDKVFGPRTGYAQPEMEVKVTATQWAWQFEYPEYGVRTGQLVLEEGRPVRLRLTSRDVVHSLFVPEFRMKFDALPGMQTQMRLVPTTVGQYRVLCAEACGLAHTYMQTTAQVLAPKDFQDWLAKQPRS